VAALGLAVARVKQVESCTRVRVYTDCMMVLKAIKDGGIVWLGPAVESTWALQKLYDRVNWLGARGIEVELVWVKGHNGDKGNSLADWAAKAPVRD
jgi:ribonuclease HI